MVKRFSWKRYAYVAFAVLVMLMCWESNRTNAMLFTASAAASEDQGPEIPKEAIRLRILANSDAPLDQWVKLRVRDAVVEEMKSWAEEPQGIEEARSAIRSHLLEIEDLVGQTLHKYGFSYDYKVELGNVPFPTKMYGNRVYPAGDYEALRISIGKAEGQNWWCVLFPPLCFIDSEVVAKENKAYAEPVAQDNSKPKADGGTNAKSSVKAAASTKTVQAKAGAAEKETKVASAAPQPEIHFFLWDLLKKIFFS